MVSKILNKGFIFVVIGIISIVLAVVCSSESIGYSESAKTYGGDAYTGIQQAAAQTANNVQDLANIVRFGFSSVLAITGLLSIAYGITYEKKVNYSNDIKAINQAVARLEETAKNTSAPCTCNEPDNTGDNTAYGPVFVGEYNN